MEERWANMAFDVAIGERSAQSMASEIVGHYASLEAQLAEYKNAISEITEMQMAVKTAHEIAEVVVRIIGKAKEARAPSRSDG
jgi:VIT1/CCC1 family predicted Fe2+/Mn2+ transporter